MSKPFSLMHGDCLELMHEIEDGSVDMILCDLPYGTTRCSWDTVIPLQPLWEHYERIIKKDGAIVLFGANPFAAILVTSNLKLFRYEIIWEKTAATGFLNAKKQPLRAHENILVFYKSKPVYNPQKTFGHKRKTARRHGVGSEHYGKQMHNLDYDSTERYPRSVQLFSKDKQKSKLHPTQKPVALCEFLVRTYSSEGDTVLDNTMGSGTTGVACLKSGRKFIGIEKNEKYFQTASKRLTAIWKKEYEHAAA
ncbi:site-specific DNA-methyltransferase [Acinetobacter baumannii]|uniref:DNA-methyltransferase n=1 Tax=Acinetobacter baumannii TaxID=470 RepID=UPI001CED9328|nr:site-specific DNA-methyltransferase [Acinetobacter baumannii]MDF7764688.1 site-specific DNA-methyltransferase [Acinetobacter baumannii]UMM96299.1 site-specific DNA-methyltransferase [Acinetobacter baumannii]UMN38669.1 site-specific DNA-methyltransferase [Acinetobacter baumannii]